MEMDLQCDLLRSNFLQTSANVYVYLIKLKSFIDNNYMPEIFTDRRYLLYVHTQMTFY